MEPNFVQIQAAFLRGIEYKPAYVEVEVSNGIGIHLVGLSDPNVKESLLRIISAIQALGYRLPGRKIVINIPNLTGKDRKTTYLDLPIALGILIASNQISVNPTLLGQCRFYGELGLDGTIRDNIKSEYVEGVDKIMIGANMVVAQDGSAAFDNLRTLINVISNHTKDYA